MIARDVTRIVHLEAQLCAARERLVEQEALRTMGEVAAGVGHDLVNILMAVKLRTASVSTQARAGVVQVRHVDAVVRAAEQAVTLASKLLGMGRPAAGPPGAVDLRRAIHDAVDLGQTALRARAGHRSLPFRILVKVPCLPAINGHSQELQRVFLNLLLNARDAMTEGGTVAVRAGVRRNAVVVWVEDEGPGIPRADLSRIFDAFFTTKGHHGSGIGLAVAKRVMDSLGGSISAANRRQGGARFTLRFPLPVGRP